MRRSETPSGGPQNKNTFYPQGIREKRIREAVSIARQNAIQQSLDKKVREGVFRRVCFVILVILFPIISAILILLMIGRVKI
jgi:hypothetical protein